MIHSRSVANITAKNYLNQKFYMQVYDLQDVLFGVGGGTSSTVASASPSATLGGDLFSEPFELRCIQIL